MDEAGDGSAGDVAKAGETSEDPHLPSSDESSMDIAINLDPSIWVAFCESAFPAAEEGEELNLIPCLRPY